MSIHNQPEARLEQYTSIPAVAAACDVDYKTVRRWIATGQLEAVRMGVRRPGTLRDTRPIRIPLSALTSLCQPVTKAGV